MGKIDLFAGMVAISISVVSKDAMGCSRGKLIHVCIIKLMVIRSLLIACLLETVVVQKFWI